MVMNIYNKIDYCHEEKIEIPIINKSNNKIKTDNNNEITKLMELNKNDTKIDNEKIEKQINKKYEFNFNKRTMFKIIIGFLVLIFYMVVVLLILKNYNQSSLRSEEQKEFTLILSNNKSFNESSQRLDVPKVECLIKKCELFLKIDYNKNF